MRGKGHGKGSFNHFSNKLGTLRFWIASYGSKPLNIWGEVGSVCVTPSPDVGALRLPAQVRVPTSPAY